ncbi:MAG: HAD family hydrolase [Acidobacteria bacterium]|nr:HAD family hydrolase [Acidobacteriota bacterium]
MKRAIFLDRDGVINRKAREGDYVTRWEDMHILPGVVAAIAQLNRLDFPVIVVSNQRCVAKGLITITELERLHERLREHLLERGARLDAIYYCPHEAEPACGCRKPQPGMLLRAAREHGIDLAASWMIGDSRPDVDAGKRAGCRTALITPGLEDGSIRPDLTETSLLEIVQKICKPRQAPLDTDQSLNLTHEIQRQP